VTTIVNSAQLSLDGLRFTGKHSSDVQKDIPEPCHGGSDDLQLQSGHEHTRSYQASVNRVSWCNANLCRRRSCSKFRDDRCCAPSGRRISHCSYT